ncbi:response regulator [Desulforhopalus sp. IMCC35007]|uniref:hybrid sensor histidine kinase/response regulator n=1 Tax=Desulforhopalus sp. IMCC35007 TaxID=2569543 RepID=UPI0010ADFB15|nr:response regulator [Desulforhopalus sp. IMCC35007]TKB06052.1 response regulator [Desulforhopalus sp. IMCC35007]
MPDKILIVDDDSLFRESMLRLLRNRHSHVESAGSGVEAINKIRTNHYAAIVLDLVLPDLEGMEIAQYIKERDPYCAVIILTGCESTISAQQAVRAGCFDYLTKPCHADQVSRVLNNGIENRRLKLELETITIRNQKLAEASWESIAFFTKSQIKEVNKQFCTLFAVDEKQVSTLSIFDFLPELALLLTPGNERAGQPASIVKSEALHPNGKIFPVELRIAPLNNSHEPQWVVAIRDLTQSFLDQLARTRLEEQLINAKRMESIGLMAGSVAHDLNNLLSSMVTLPELLLLDMPENAKYRRDINKIKTAGKQAAAVVSDLLTITRGSTSQKKVKNLNSVVDEYRQSQELSHLRKSYPEIIIEIDTSPQVSNSRLSTIHVLKSIINLVRNGIESIDGPGAVTIHTSKQRFLVPHQGYETIPQGEFAVLTVADTGTGIKKEHLKHIFEPFFTNKNIGKTHGTGLGLTVIQHTMRDHYGYIDIRKGPTGTIFELYFPIIAQQERHIQEPKILNTMFGKGESILIVDDEKEQLDIISSVLNRLGYKTASVTSGEKAIEHIKENHVDLVLLDMVLKPGINGYQTLKNILEINPQQKAVITSGQLNHPDRDKTRQMGVSQYLAKPVSLSLLARTIQQEIYGEAQCGLDNQTDKKQ